MPSWKGAYAFEFRGYVSEWSYSPRASAVGRPAKGVGRWAKDDTEMPAIGGQVPVCQSLQGQDGLRMCGPHTDPMRKILRIKREEVRGRAGPQDGHLVWPSSSKRA